MSFLHEYDQVMTPMIALFRLKTKKLLNSFISYVHKLMLVQISKIILTFTFRVRAESVVTPYFILHLFVNHIEDAVTLHPKLVTRLVNI